MRYFSIIRADENQGAPPQALMDAMDVYVAKTLQNGTVVSTGGLAPSGAGVSFAWSTREESFPTRRN